MSYNNPISLLFKREVTILTAPNQFFLKIFSRHVASERASKDTFVIGNCYMRSKILKNFPHIEFTMVLKVEVFPFYDNLKTCCTILFLYFDQSRVLDKMLGFLEFLLFNSDFQGSIKWRRKIVE